MHKYSDWNIQGCAPIISIDELLNKVWSTQYLVCTSGGFDPIHPGHISCMIESKKFNPILAVIVNGDSFLTVKKGKPFQNLKTRCQIVAAIREVDYVVPFEIDGDLTTNVILEQLRPGIFTKGGDRIDADTIPEWETCKRNKIRVMTGVGHTKNWSSSNFLDDWARFTRRNR